MRTETKVTISWKNEHGTTYFVKSFNIRDQHIESVLWTNDQRQADTFDPERIDYLLHLLWRAYGDEQRYIVNYFQREQQWIKY